MKLDKIKNQLEKIDTLLTSIMKGQEEISSVERDLMLSYIRKMYELALEEKSSRKSVSTNKKKKKEPKIVEVMDIIDKPKIVEKAIELKEEVKKEAKREEENKPEEATSKSKPESSDSAAQNSSLQVPDEVRALFNHKKAVELSEKLGDSPISDLKKAMGINEKIFTIQELFGGKQTFFNEAISQLNSFSNFEDAKDYLIKNVAVSHNWGEAGKKKKASHFIKLIRRRYK